MTLGFQLEEGKYYQIERTVSGSPWEPVGEALLGRGEEYSINISAAEADEHLYRAAEISQEWVMVWNDEFDGQDLDRSKWSVDVNANGGGNNELQYYTDREENVYLENGNLVLEARDEDYGGLDGFKEYTSGKITSKHRGYWKYGKFEARAKLPVGQGMWPAFWMLPMPNQYGGWAASGEIDIMELVGNEPSTAHGTIHYGQAWPKNASTGTEVHLDSGTFADDFHVFGIEWEEGEIRWYLDGELFQTLTNWYSENGDFPAPFDEAFYLILNLAVGGNWPGNPDGSTQFPAKLEVDWVRVYQWVE